VFTGIIEELGHLRSRQGPRLTFAAPAILAQGGTTLGDSIAVNGCCLTVVEVGDGWWGADAVDETLSRTNLVALRPGDPVNLERPLRLADRLGGHLVQGHVDALGTVEQPAPDLVVSAPPSVMRYVMEKGSITVDGVSLTVVNVCDEQYAVAVIPHTAAVTTLGQRGVGSSVNLEADMVAKYVERLARPAGTAVQDGRVEAGAATQGAPAGAGAGAGAVPHADLLVTPRRDV